MSCNQNGKNVAIGSVPVERIEVHEMSTLIIEQNPKLIKQYEIKAGNEVVFVYLNEGETFIDAEDYDAKYLESLVFSIPDSITSFEKSAEELQEINCTYSWTVISKIPEKISKPIREGSIRGQKDSNGKWSVDINVETGHKFGGYLERQSSRGISMNKSDLSGV